jgi:hypothetical protein
MDISSQDIIAWRKIELIEIDIKSLEQDDANQAESNLRLNL